MSTMKILTRKDLDEKFSDIKDNFTILKNIILAQIVILDMICQDTQVPDSIRNKIGRHLGSISNIKFGINTIDIILEKYNDNKI